MGRDGVTAGPRGLWATGALALGPDLDGEAQRSNLQRLQQVTRARWIALGGFVLYVACLYFVALRGDGSLLSPEQLHAPVASLFVVFAYNLLFQLTHRRWAQVWQANLWLLLLDTLIVTVVVHYSGGIQSLFWVLYVLIIMETAFLLERPREIWTVMGFVLVLYGGLIGAEHFGALPTLPMPFLRPALLENHDFLLVTLGLVLAICSAVCGVSITLARMIRDREAALRQMVVRDELTGLYNRRHFFQCLHGELARCERYGGTFSLLLVDLDDFKQINDRQGHLIGDEVLRASAKILGASLRRSGGEQGYDVDIACRYGGEEFAIILPETGCPSPAGGAFRVAERVRNRLSATLISGHRITATIGLCTFPEHGRTPDELIAAADEALYRAKAQGKNRVLAAAPAGLEPAAPDGPARRRLG